MTRRRGDVPRPSGTGGRRGARGDRGTASLELVALFPLVLGLAVIVLQVGAVIYGAVSAQEAARVAARASSRGLDPAAAAAGSLPAFLSLASVTSIGPGHGVRISVDIPRVSPLPAFTVTREAVMP